MVSRGKKIWNQYVKAGKPSAKQTADIRNSSRIDSVTKAEIAEKLAAYLERVANEKKQEDIDYTIPSEGNAVYAGFLHSQFGSSYDIQLRVEDYSDGMIIFDVYTPKNDLYNSPSNLGHKPFELMGLKFDGELESWGYKDKVTLERTYKEGTRGKYYIARHPFEEQNLKIAVDAQELMEKIGLTHISAEGNETIMNLEAKKHENCRNLAESQGFNYIKYLEQRGNAKYNNNNSRS